MVWNTSSEMSTGQVASKILEIYFFVCCKNLSPSSDPKMSMLLLTPVQCLILPSLLCFKLTTWRMLILYFENSTFCVVMSWSVRSVFCLWLVGHRTWTCRHLCASCGAKTSYTNYKQTPQPLTNCIQLVATCIQCILNTYGHTEFQQKRDSS